MAGLNLSADAYSMPLLPKGKCELLPGGVFARALGNWKGTQRKWNPQGELIQELESSFIVTVTFEPVSVPSLIQTELPPTELGESSGSAFAQLTVSSEYHNVLRPNEPSSKNDWKFTCNKETGAWQAAGFGGSALATLKPLDELLMVTHAVEVKGSTTRSLSTWDLSGNESFALSTNWYSEGKLTSTSINLMQKVAGVFP